MQRREFIAGLAGAAAWPLATLAQQPATPVIGFLSAQSAELDYRNVTVPFLQGLQKTGYVVGQNVEMEYRWAEDQYDRLPVLVAGLVRRHVAVIVASGVVAARLAKTATATIPIVFVVGADPVALGLVDSLNRPGANATGTVGLGTELAPKKLQLLRELIPNAARFGVLVDPGIASAQFVVADLRAAARTLGLQLIVVNAETDSDQEMGRVDPQIRPVSFYGAGEEGFHLLVELLAKP
jgi:putative ABC transport system substrate-binding protein